MTEIAAQPDALPPAPFTYKAAGRSLQVRRPYGAALPVDVRDARALQITRRISLPALETNP